jgi:hypothetical protein
MEGEVFLCLAYLPPQGFSFWSKGVQVGNVFADLEGGIPEAKSSEEVLIAGDLDARMKVERDWMDTSNIEFHLGVGSPDAFEATGLRGKRCSADKMVNALGKVLLQLLRGTDLSVLYGRMKGKDGAFTSIHSFGYSVIDLYIASTGAAVTAEGFEVLEILRELSDHMTMKVGSR